MRTFTLHTELWLPRTREEIFPFFADAYNLESITPPILNFSVLTPKPIEMHAGTLIDYRLKLRGIPIRWRTRIAAWEPPYRFIDEQLKGPYRLWHHEHLFKPENGGTRCIDHVTYAVPGGPGLERLAEKVFVRRDVHAIFKYRERKMLELFGTPTPPTSDASQTMPPSPAEPALVASPYSPA